MPRKYRPGYNDIFVFAAVPSVYGMLKPIEDKLRAGGYKGPLLADFDNGIYKNLGVIDEEATRKKQDAENRKNGANARKVLPVYKKTDIDYNDLGNSLPKEEKGNIIIENHIGMSSTWTKEGEKTFRKNLKAYDDLLDLLIKNTPEDEYPEELAEMKFHKTYIRMFKVFGSKELLQDQLGFITNARAYDGDLSAIKYEGLDSKKATSREIWRQVHKSYPYNDLRDSMIELINAACDYEENKEKESYIEQIKARERYKKGLEDYLSASKSIMNSKEEFEKYSHDHYREEVIKQLKEKDGPDKNIDYDAIYNRVKEQKSKKLEVNPEDAKIFDDINNRVDQKISSISDDVALYSSKYYKEINTYGDYYINEKDFTGVRGNSSMFGEVEAQINAIDMGWPMDELIHIQRLLICTRRNFNHNSKNLTNEQKAIKNSVKDFYETRIKDKPYPATEEGRRALYQEMYDLSNKIVGITRQKFENQVNDEESVEVEWTELRDGIKKSMDKPLTFADKLIIDHVQNAPEPVISYNGISAIKKNIDMDRMGHRNSSDYKKLKEAFDKLEKIYKADPDGLTEELQGDNVSPEILKILKDIKDSSAVYLKEKDKEKKLPEQRSTMGKARYNGAKDAYHFADKILKEHEAKLEKEAKEKKEQAREKERKITKKAFLDTTGKIGERYLKYEKYKAGSQEAYEKLKADEAKKEAEEAAKEPVTDEEKFEKYIDNCRVKKDAPVTEAEKAANDELQQTRVNNLGKMLAAMEFQEAGKAFNEEELNKRGDELRILYGLDALKNSTDKVNGPEKLKNALTFKFRADDIKHDLEESLYEVGKGGFRNTNDSQKNYLKDISSLLDRKKPGGSSEFTQDLIDALQEFKNIDISDKSFVGLNAAKIKKANVRLMNEINKVFDNVNKMDMDSYGPKLALDTLAVMNSYTGCQAVTNKIIQKINSRVKDMNGNAININAADFNQKYGVNNANKQKADENNARIKNDAKNIQNVQPGL